MIFLHLYQLIKNNVLEINDSVSIKFMYYTFRNQRKATLIIKNIWTNGLLLWHTQSFFFDFLELEQSVLNDPLFILFSEEKL